MSGTSRELFENWCEDKKNSLIITDFAVQGKLSHIVLVHGERGEIEKLSRELSHHAISLDIERHVFTPEISQQVTLYHKNERSTKIIGKLAKNKPIEDNSINGILIQKIQNDLILHPHDLAVYTNLKTSGISHRQVLPLKIKRTFNEIYLELTASFKHIVRVSISKDSSNPAYEKLIVGNIVNVIYYSEKNLKNLMNPILKLNNLKYGNSLILEWLGGLVADLIVDCIIIFITKIENVNKYVQNTIKPVDQKISNVKNPNIFINMFENIN